MHPQIKPKRLYPGNTIGVLAPASHGSLESTQAGIRWLEQQGFKVFSGQTLAKSYGYLAGTDAERSADLHAMFADPAIDGIVCLRGGYGTMRLLPLLDYELIRRNPKVFVGYSDITALHISIGQRTGLVTFHGPMAASDMGKGLTDYTLSCFVRATMNGSPFGLVSASPQADPPAWIAHGTAKGQLTGGNLSLVVATLGTPYEIDTRGKILCLEEVGEQPYRIDRMLTQLLLAGKLQQAAGIVVAVCADCEDEDTEAPGFTLEQVLQDRLGGLGISVLYKLHFGHTPDKATLPMGVMAMLDTDGLRVLEAGTVE